jgi:hypothetical protein
MPYFLLILFTSFTAICNASSHFTNVTLSSVYRIFNSFSGGHLGTILISLFPFFHSFTNIYLMLNKSGDSSHPCLTLLFISIVNRFLKL